MTMSGIIHVHKVNRWFRHAPETFTTTVDLQMRVAVVAEQLARVAVTRRPPLRQLRAGEVLARVASSMRFDEEVQRVLGLDSAAVPTSMVL